MKWIINYQLQDEYMSINLTQNDFWGFPQEIKYREILFQKKREFHITLFSWIDLLDSEVSDSIGSILYWYRWIPMSDIELWEQLYHIQKWKKQSLISRIYSKETEECIREILKNLNIILADAEKPFLHTTVYTTDEYPRGISLDTLTGFKNHNRWEFLVEIN